MVSLLDKSTTTPATRNPKFNQISKRQQPPKKRGAPTSSSATKKPRQSKLAKENDISNDEENEIKEVFHLFSTTRAEFKNEKESVIAREDVRKALVYVSTCLAITA
jgi:hypothetical protein